jgi:hypothetical protein
MWIIRTKAGAVTIATETTTILKSEIYRRKCHPHNLIA